MACRFTQQPWRATSEDYLRYIDLANDMAGERTIEADVIERRLFDLGS